MWTHCRSWPINVIILNEIVVRMIFCLGTGNNWWQWSMSLALLYDTILVTKSNWWINEENKHCRRCQYGTKIFFRHVNRWKNFPQYNNTLVSRQWWQAYSHGISCERFFGNIAKREYVYKNIWSYNIAIRRALICLIEMLQCSVPI